MDALSLPRHVIRLADLEDGVLDDVLELSARLKRRAARRVLTGRTVGMLFFRRSLRTRASFEAAISQLGGHPVNLAGMADLWELESREGSVMDGRAREHVRDAAAVLSKYVDALAIRPKADGASWDVDRRDERMRTWARHATVPVINMESILWHPLQALGDLLTMREALGDLEGKPLAVVWTHSPEPASSSVVNSLVHAALRFGMHVRVSHPAGYELDESVLAEAEELAGGGAGSFATGMPREEAVRDARMVYARSWKSIGSYGNPTLAATQASRHTAWRIDEALMSLADDAHLMHAMPIRRNVEATDEVIDGPRSLLYEQASNRMYSQMALLANLLRG